MTVGEPLDLSDLTCRCHRPGVDQAQVWRDITSRMHEAVERLSAVSPPNPYQRENPTGKPGMGALKENLGEPEAATAPQPSDDPRLAGRA